MNWDNEEEREELTKEFVDDLILDELRRDTEDYLEQAQLRSKQMQRWFLVAAVIIIVVILVLFYLGSLGS